MMIKADLIVTKREREDVVIDLYEATRKKRKIECLIDLKQWQRQRKQNIERKNVAIN